MRKLNFQLPLLVCIIVALVLTSYVAYEYKALEEDANLALEANTDLEMLLEQVNAEKQNLQELSTYQQSIIDNFQSQIEQLGGTVGTLEKLSQTDRELLKKYSKVYFLSENYVPAKLETISPEYVFEGATNLLFYAEAWPFLKKLLYDAHRNNMPLLVASAFRSFDTQASLKSDYSVIYGAGTANQFSADQGYSEHQLGTAIDFTTMAVGGVNSKFETDPAYQWLLDYAYQYGFVLSYPKNNSYYKFEPWHWRFVGVEIATFLHQSEKYFYDLDQREIDGYLIKLFD